MARIRSLKPEFWTSEQVVACSTTARLLIIGMLNFADDNGINPDKPMRLKMQIFPADPYTGEQMAGLIDELEENELVRRYEVEGKKYVQITTFVKHQRIDQPTYKFPLPNGEIPASPARRRYKKHGVAESVRRTSAKPSTSDQPVFSLGEEWSGEDRSGEDNIKPSSSPSGTEFSEQSDNQNTPSLKRANGKSNPLQAVTFDIFWSRYPKRAGNNPRQAAVRHWNARIKSGVDTADILKGLDRYVRYLNASKTVGTKFVLQASTFLGPDNCWEQAWTIPKDDSKTAPVTKEEFASQDYGKSGLL